MAKKEKKKGMFKRFSESARRNTLDFCDEVAMGKDYQNLYDLNKALKKCDGDHLMIGVVGISAGLLLWVMTVLFPFILSGTFKMGAGGWIGFVLLASGIAYYMGAYRLLHPLYASVNREKDDRIQEILEEREDNDTDGETKENADTDA